jgi:hypothetical protein
VIVKSRPPSAIRRTFVCLALLLASALSQTHLRAAAAPPTAAITAVSPDPRTLSLNTIAVVFSEAVTGVTLDDFTLTRDGGGDLLTGAQTVTTSNNITWTLNGLNTLTGAEGVYQLTLIANGSILNGTSEALAVGDVEMWTVDTTGPTAFIDQAADQDDPANVGEPVSYTVTFSEPINPSTFDESDIDWNLSQVTPASTTITQVAPNDGTTFRLTFEGMGPGELGVQLNPGSVDDLAGNQMFDSTGGDLYVDILCADTVTVTSTADDGAGSLRWAIRDVCDSGTIDFDIAGPGPHTITLSEALFIDKVVDIVGPDTESVILDGNDANELMVVDSDGNVALRQLTFSNAYTFLEGAAILNWGGTVYIYNSLFTGNAADFAGGAITNEGYMEIYNTTISGNSTGGVGGGIFNCDCALLMLVNVTITDNQAGDQGGGIFNGADVLVVNSIVAGNTAVNEGNDIFDDTMGLTQDGGNNILSGDPMIGPLQDNGGPSLSHAPLPGSPAIDTGNDAAACGCFDMDQRGSAFGRFRDGDGDGIQTVDIGAIEVDPSIENIANQSTPQGVASAVEFYVADADSPFDSITATSSNTTLVPNDQLVVATVSPNLRTLTVTPAPGQSGTSTITVTASKTVGGYLVSMSDTFLLTVAAVNTPTITGATTVEDVQTSSGLVISPNVADGPEIMYFKITGITGGTLFKNDGVTPVALNAFITVAEGAAGLRFTPAPHTFGTGTVTVRASTTASDAGLGTTAATATITIAPVADTPSITNASTIEDTQTTSGLVITRNLADGPEVTHFQIVEVSGGTLFKNDGVTPVGLGRFVTVAEGLAGLRFTPTPHTFGTGAVGVRASVSDSDAGVGGGVATAVITISPVADTPSITNAFTYMNQQTTAGLVVTPNPTDGMEVTHFQVTAISGGQLFFDDGLTPIAVGAFITRDQGAAGMAFTPSTGSTQTGQVSVRASLSASAAGLGGGTATGSILIGSPTAFTNDPLVPGQTVIRAAHLIELRARVNALRERFGLPVPTLHAPTPGLSVIGRMPLIQVREALTEAYAAASMPAPVFTDPGLPAGTMIKALHIQELRAAIVALEASPRRRSR